MRMNVVNWCYIMDERTPHIQLICADYCWSDDSSCVPLRLLIVVVLGLRLFYFINWTVLKQKKTDCVSILSGEKTELRHAFILMFVLLYL